MVLYLRKWTVEFVSFKGIDEFIHRFACGKCIQIEVGMPTEELPVRRKVDRVCIAVVEQVGHELFENTDFISSGIQIEEFSLFGACKLIDF